MKKTKKIIVFLLAVILFFACSSNPINLSDWFESTNAKRSNIKVPTSYEEYIRDIDLSSVDNNFSFDMDFDEDVPNYLSNIDAQEEIEVLFQQLYINYGLYFYYGENKFEEAKQSCLQDIRKISGDVDRNTMIDILGDNLSFIRDSHFLINHSKTFQNSYNDVKTYYSNDIKLDCAETCIDLNTKKELKEVFVDSKKIEINDILKPVLDDKGKISYQFVYLSNVEPQADLVFDDNTEIPLSMNVYERKVRESQEFLFDKVNGVQVLRPGSFGDNNKDEESLLKDSDFINTIPQVKNDERLLIDLRNNPGGYSTMPQKWTEEVLGESGYHAYQIYRRNPFISKTIEEFKEMFHFVNVDIETSSYIVAKPIQELMENQKEIIVLTDENTYSAAERYVDMLHGYENVLFVGTNTNGTAINGGTYYFETKLMKIPMLVGNSLFLYSEDYFIEQEGFAPDIYYFGNQDLVELLSKMK